MKLAYGWSFGEVKRLACRNLETFILDPIRKIELYQLYELDKRLLIPSYVALITRSEPLSLAEGRRLTLETALLIATARECARGKLERGRHSPVEATVKEEAMVTIIKQVFSLADTTPTSPSLEPISEGRGPSAFTATPLSPSKINTSPPPRHDTMSPTPLSKSIASNAPPQSLMAAIQSPPQTATPAATTASISSLMLPPAGATPPNKITPPAITTSSSKDGKQVPQTPIAPERPAYLQTTFSTSAAPSTPLKSATSSGPVNVADLFSDSAANKDSKDNKDKSVSSTASNGTTATKPGQSSAVRPFSFYVDGSC